MSAAATRKRSVAAGRTSALADGWRLGSGVGFLIRLMDARYSALYQDMSGQEAITPRQFGVLVALYQNSPMTLTDLATTVRADRSTLGEMIKRMALRKLVKKSDNGADGRSYEVSIAPAGRKALLEVVGAADELQRVFLAPLPEKDRAHFLHCLRLVAFGERAEGEAT